MTLRDLVPVGALGERMRKAFVAAALLACTYIAWELVRDPAWEGWWDAYNWPQLFLGAPLLFFAGAAIWQSICAIVAWFHGKTHRTTESLETEASQDIQKTPKFWLRDSLRICVLYITTCVIGDTPMVVNYIAAVRGWSLHLWWSTAVNSCFLLMIAVWWVLQRFRRRMLRRS